jgi:tRNA threonylcarbamoyladenosine biosynthesis protein TsaE
MRKNGFFLCLISKSAEETREIGRIIGEQLGAGDILALTGELGSGKTCITQGVARGIQVPEEYPITSPTFTLINEYPGRVMLYHMDMYRLTGPEDLADMGYEDYFYGDGLVVIEWAEKISDILPADNLYVSMRYLDESSREIRIAGDADKAGKINASLKAGGFC